MRVITHEQPIKGKLILTSLLLINVKHYAMKQSTS
jgi:hypothetical protein